MKEEFHTAEVLVTKAIRWASSSAVLLAVIIFLLVWTVFGPYFGFSAGWQLSMTTPTTAITFLMVFLLLRAQHKDTRAIQLKLNEIIAALNGANNQLIDIENMSEHAIAKLDKRYETVAQHIKGDNIDNGLTESIVPHEIAEKVDQAAEKDNQNFKSRK